MVKRGEVVMRKIVTVSLLLVGFVSNCFAATWYVNASKIDNSGAATNWATAVRDIQSAVDKAGDNDKIWVEAGVYNKGGAVNDGSSSLSNRVSIGTHLYNLVIEAVHKGLDETIIEGAADPGTGGNGPNATRCFCGNGQVQSIQGWLIGFTLRNGYTWNGGSPSWPHDEVGGGMHSGQASNCWIYSNIANSGGGAWGYSYLYDCNVYSNTGWEGGAGLGGEVWDSTIYANHATKKGGACYSSVLHSCIVSNNMADDYGGAMYNECKAYDCQFINNSTPAGYAGVMAASCIASNCIIKGNSAASNGSVIQELDSVANRCYLYNCLITKNYAGGLPGSTILGYVTLVNCTIVNNESGFSGATAGLDGYTVNAVTSINCIVYGNTNSADGIEHNYTNMGYMVSCLTSPDPTGQAFDGGGNITGDPIFRDAANGNYHFSVENDSPAIDAGTATGATASDLDGVLRPKDGNHDGSTAYDIGCYEHVYVPPRGTLVIVL